MKNIIGLALLLTVATGLGAETFAHKFTKGEKYRIVATVEEKVLRNDKLIELFLHKPYQGADPATAQFLLFGLDANYAPDVGEQPCFPEIVAYLEDGVRYWKERGHHHPFLHPEYRGDGALYHRRFAEIGFTNEHAELVSFVELIDVPTSGRSSLRVSDLAAPHLNRLREWVLNGSATYIFIPPGVAGLLRLTPQFSWLPEKPISHDGSLPVLFRSDRKVVFSPFHFSCVGKHCLKKYRDLQIQDIGELLKVKH